VAPGSTGLWDPWGFCSKTDVTKEKIDFYRDAETKHGRLGMLATFGILYSESSHPVAGTDMDGLPAIMAMGKMGMFWPAFFIAAGVLESNSMRGDVSGDRRVWDPLNLAKGDAAVVVENKNTELAFGRIGMVGAIGMMVQEMITNKPILSSL
jgi:hypothetical protein